MLQKKDGDSEEVEVGTLKTSDYFGQLIITSNLRKQLKAFSINIKSILQKMRPLTLHASED